MKTSDIPDQTIFTTIATIRTQRNMSSASLWDIQAALFQFPPKLVHAKLSIMVRRKRLHGCSCGCRGDFYPYSEGITQLS